MSVGGVVVAVSVVGVDVPVSVGAIIVSVVVLVSVGVVSVGIVVVPVSTEGGGGVVPDEGNIIPCWLAI